MKEKVFRKLNSKAGASISFALFAFIIATVVSLVIVAAALTNVIKVRQERENEQAYLVAQSVSYLLMDEILPTDNGKVTAEGAKKETNRYVRILDVNGDGSEVLINIPSTGGEGVVFSEPFYSTIKDCCEKNCKNPGMAPETTIKVSLSDSAPEKLKEKMAETTVTLKMTDGYDLEFLISVPTYKVGTQQRFYTSVLHFYPSVETKNSAVYVYWPTAKPEKNKEVTP